MFLPMASSLLFALAIFLLTWYGWHQWQKFLSPQKTFWQYLDAIPTHRLIAILGRKKRLTALLEVAGLPRDWTTQRFLILKQVSILGIVILLGRSVFSIPGLILLAAGWFCPELYLQRRVVFRKREAIKTLGSVIDLLRLQVESGSNLESAIRTLAEQKKDLWGEELSRAVFLLDRGVPFEEALNALGRRFEMEDLNRLILAIKQAKVLGASLSDTLMIQADALRTRRRQQAEEKARLASVKIALPLVFFIFPALLIVYLAPAVLRIMESF